MHIYRVCDKKTRHWYREHLCVDDLPGASLSLPHHRTKSTQQKGWACAASQQLLPPLPTTTTHGQRSFGQQLFSNSFSHTDSIARARCGRTVSELLHHRESPKLFFFSLSPQSFLFLVCFGTALFGCWRRLRGRTVIFRNKISKRQNTHAHVETKQTKI
jgi:hypothetical protein